MKTVTITTIWRATDSVEVPDDYEVGSTLDEVWADQVDALGAELIDWSAS
jgi:hypothetical protein